MFLYGLFLCGGIGIGYLLGLILFRGRANRLSGRLEALQAKILADLKAMQREGVLSWEK